MMRIGLMALVVLLMLSGSALAQVGPGPIAAFPTGDATDGKFLSFGCMSINTLEAPVSLTVAADPSQADFTLSFFDGETGGVDTAGRKHWDTGEQQLVFRLYSDPFRQGNRDPADLIGEWFGNDLNPTAGPGWTASVAQMPDNDWWGVTVQTSSESQATPGGHFFYHLQIFLDGPCTDTDLASNLKVAASDPATFSVSGFFAIEGGLRQMLNDRLIIYPTLGDPSFEFAFAPTTYDGVFTFGLELPAGSTEFSLFDGDFDLGVHPDLPPPNPLGIPPGFGFSLRDTACRL